MEDFYKIVSLIRKFRIHHLDEKEVRQLWEWVNTNNNNQLFKRLLNRKYEVELLHQLQQYDSESAYQRFISRISSPRRHIRHWFRIAALFLLPLISGALIYWWTSHTEKTEVPFTQSVVITPGGSRAILTLTSGKQIHLGDSMAEKNLSDANSHLQYDSTGLYYEQKKSKEISKKNTLYVPRKGEFSLVLSDGTKVYLNSDTRLIYPVIFEEGKREVELQGEAYFEVAHDSVCPFMVKTKDMTVKVLGTAFNVKSYADENRIETTLVEGKVNIIQGKQQLPLSPGEQIRYNPATGHLEKVKVNPLLYVSWKDGLFIFERQRLEDLFTILSRWYDVEIFFERQELKERLFTGDLKKYSDINVCLQMLELTNEIKFEIRGNTILVK